MIILVSHNVWDEASVGDYQSGLVYQIYFFLFCNMVDKYQHPHANVLYNEKLLEEVYDVAVARELTIKDLSSKLMGARRDSEKGVCYRDFYNQSSDTYPNQRLIDFSVNKNEQWKIVVALSLSIANPSKWSRLKRNLSSTFATPRSYSVGTSYSAEGYWLKSDDVVKITGNPQNIVHNVSALLKQGFLHRKGKQEILCKAVQASSLVQMEKQIETAVRLLQAYLRV